MPDITRIEIPTEKKPDPNATPRVDIVDDGKGGVKRDPALTPAPADEKRVEGERPAWLPEKFKTVEEMAASYSELEKKLGGKPAEATAVTPEAAKAAGIDLPALAQEFAENGELSAETLKTLTDKGFDKKAVDGFIAGQQAIAEKLTGQLAALAGGPAKLTATLEWAKANLSAEDAAAYNAALDSGDISQAKLALQGVIAQYTEANGTEPALIEGGEGARTSGVAPYESQAQIVAAMSDKRYKTDPAYREKVAQRIYVTPSFGTK